MINMPNSFIDLFLSILYEATHVLDKLLSLNFTPILNLVIYPSHQGQSNNQGISCLQYASNMIAHVYIQILPTG
jgi:hypothetical protein